MLWLGKLPCLPPHEGLFERTVHLVCYDHIRSVYYTGLSLTELTQLIEACWDVHFRVIIWTESGTVIFFLGNSTPVLLSTTSFYAPNYARFIACNDTWWVSKVRTCVSLYSRGVGHGFLEYLQGCGRLFIRMLVINEGNCTVIRRRWSVDGQKSGRIKFRRGSLCTRSLIGSRRICDTSWRGIKLR